tara:strand:- start:4 stop:159 length:156 start_codon:yes stop_codon:yes gene_type:complete
MILRSGNNSVINVPHKYWEKLGWKLNDTIEIEYNKDSIILVNKGRDNGQEK